MILDYKKFLKTNEEAAPRIPKSLKYWVDKLGKKGKDVMIYTHDDLDGIFSAIAIKKYLIDKGFNIVGYGIVNYQEGWDVFNIDKELINVAVDFAEPHPDIDVYIDHHGEFVEGDEMADEVRKKGAIKTETGSAYEGIMDQLGLPVDSLVLDVIDMVDSAKYDEYGVKWTDLLDFDLEEIKKKPNAKLLFAGAFNQLLKRGDYQTIIEVIHNVNEPSIYKIFDYMKRLYPGNNLWLPRGTKLEDFSEEELAKLKGKEFVEDATWRIEQMKKRTRGTAEFKGVINSQREFVERFTKVVAYDPDSRSKFAGQSAEVLEMDGYCVIGELVFVGSGTWANAIRARAIIQQDIESGRLPKEAENVKWVLLQYGDTLQMCSYGKIEQYEDEELPTTKDGKPINDLKVFCINLLNNFKDKLKFYNPDTIAGGHKGIGTISNIGISSFLLPPDDNDYYFLGVRFLDLFKNYIIASLSKIPWRIDLSWENPFSHSHVEEPVPVDARVMKINQIRLINKQTGEIELPDDYERKLSMKAMKENAAKLKELEKELEEQKIKEGVLKAKAKHQYHRKDRGDVDYEEWSEEQKKKAIEKDKEEIEEVQDKIQDEVQSQDEEKEVTESVVINEKSDNIKSVFKNENRIMFGLTEAILKGDELTVTHKGNMGNTISKNVNPNLEKIGLPTINELKKKFDVKLEEGSPDYMYKITFEL